MLLSHSKRMSTLLACMAVSGSCAGCKDKTSGKRDEPPDAPTQASSQAAEASAVSASASPPEDLGCPAGRWKYDYSDQALEVMLKNVADAKVVKEEGEFVCTVSEGKTGTIVCDTQGKPVVNVVETKKAGIPMTISVSISGKAESKFSLVSAQRMQVVSSDTSALEIETSVSLGGKSIPFPTDKLITIFGEPKSYIAYRCDDKGLSLKPEIANVDNTWQQLTRVK